MRKFAWQIYPIQQMQPIDLNLHSEFTQQNTQQIYLQIYFMNLLSEFIQQNT